MIVEVDPSSPLPPYEQVRAQIADLIGAGVLAKGSQLPSIRQLAADLGLAAGTVARAYRELEAAGLVAAGGRHGTRVAVEASPEGRDRRVAQAALAFAHEIVRLGISQTAALHAAREAIAATKRLT